ncbi:hypothetical protein FPZ24_01700 [Sphingomonas panacisoli]|uniref:DUF1579 domain-containing protein n=1 Tax=Sphingomonas panacisoli TaxID=1813879 RepID=A0A5B8LFA3_9SPHN|nr:hypothetical protein [Sphingomonas panacisoli]QDZ06342.1 hypothetical protein FPZ24_01700 [Sphingomonas panacisoli]
MRSVSLVLLIAVASPAFGQTASNTGSANPRAAFDFLLGEWQVQPADGTAPRPDLYYRFSKPAETPVIAGDWKFDRGVAGKPDIAVGKYYSGYDNTTATWSFYYVSDRSAQAWPGTLKDGTWYFEHDFMADGKPFHQRQWWEIVDQRTIRRHIENTAENGAAPPGVVITLVKRSG